MIYTLKVKDKDYDLTLTTKDILQIEKKIGMNPIMIFGADGKRIPTVTELLAIIGASFHKFNHGITESETYDIMDDWFAEGHEVGDLIVLVVEIFKASGLFRDKKSKNQ